MIGRTEANPNSSTLTAWMVENIENIKNGTAVFNGERVTLQSELVRFESCSSFLVVCTQQSSPYYLKGSSEASKAARVAVFSSALLGWWSIPGIIYTPITLFNNFLQMDKITVGDLIKEVETPPKKLHPAMRIMAVVMLVLIVAGFVWAGMQAKQD